MSLKAVIEAHQRQVAHLRERRAGPPVPPRALLATPETREVWPVRPPRTPFTSSAVVPSLASALFGWLPVLGWGTVILGLAIILGLGMVARFMDRLEVRAKRIFKPLGATFVGLSTWTQLSISPMIAGSIFGFMYGLLYSPALGG